MTDEELAGQSGALATRSDEEEVDPAVEPVFSPQDFRLDLRAKLAVATEEPLPNLDSPAIRKLTWEHVVPDRPVSTAPSATTTVPLPPPRRVPPPPPLPTSSLQPPAPVAASEPVAQGVVEAVPVEEVPVEEFPVEEFVVEDEPEVEDLVEEVEPAVDDDNVEPVAEPVAEPAASVAAPEVNTLASVPDLFDDDDDTPIELPPITPSGPIVAHAQSVYAPVLAETLYVVPPPRPATTTVAVTPGPTKQPRRKANRKPRRHLFRTFLTLVLLFGLLGGGAFAAKTYLLQLPEWPVELQPLADEVAASRGLQFKVTVPVVEVPISDYARRLAGSAIDTRADSAPAWRALGLLNGELDLETIGRQALNDAPAFYDPANKTIYVSDDLKAFEHLHRFAMHRALATALLDQRYDWSSRVDAASPAAALGIRATIDGDALAVANALAMNDGPDQLAPELFAFVQGHGSTVSPSQYAATLAGRAGVAMRPTIAAMASDVDSLATLEQATPSSDAILDVARPPAVADAPAGMQGMMFWYYVLASRIDDGQAWSAATRWTADSLVPSTGSTGKCVDAKIAAGDADSAAVLLAAFQVWAAVAPLESTTTVVPIEDNQVAVRACDPSATVTALVPVKVPLAFGGAGVERALVQAAVSAAGDTKVDAACLVNAARARGTVLTSPADDAPVIAVNWQSPYVAANIDLATGCVSPAS